MATSTREYAMRGWKFGIVGASGFLVNQGLLMLFVGSLGIKTWLAGAMAIEISIVSNWLINDLWTWRDRRRNHWFYRLMKYNITAGLTAFGVNYPVLLLLSGPVGMNYAVANIIGIGLSALANFFVNHHWTYRGK